MALFLVLGIKDRKRTISGLGNLGEKRRESGKLAPLGLQGVCVLSFKKGA